MLPYICFLGKTVRMYGLCIAVGMVVAGFFMAFECKKKKLLWENALIAMATAIGTGFIGSKILYLAVTFTPQELLEIIKQGKTHDILSGGFVFYGGLICGVLGALLGIRVANCRMTDYENVLIKTVPLAHGFGRIGCFCAGCCYGKPTAGILHVIYSHPVSDAPVGVPLVPVQLYEALFNFILFFVLLAIDRKYPKNRILLPVYILAYSAERFIIEFFRYDAARGFWLGLSTSQWISAAVFAAGAVLLAVRVSQKKAAQTFT